MNKQTHKVTDEQFIEALRACEGNFSRTAKYIREHYNVPYSKQAVQARAKNFPDEMKNLNGLIANQCSTNLMAFADDENNDIRLRVRIYQHLLAKANQRERLQQQVDKDAELPDQVWRFGNLVIIFVRRALGEKQRDAVLAHFRKNPSQTTY